MLLGFCLQSKCVPTWSTAPVYFVPTPQETMEGSFNFHSGYQTIIKFGSQSVGKTGLTCTTCLMELNRAWEGHGKADVAPSNDSTILSKLRYGLEQHRISGHPYPFTLGPAPPRPRTFNRPWPHSPQAHGPPCPLGPTSYHTNKLARF